jgi:hypothetical protein
MHLKDVWEQTTLCYTNCPINKDDIIDLRDARLFKDCSMVRNLKMQIKFGNIFVLDQPGNDTNSNVSSAPRGDEDDFDEIDMLSHGTQALHRLEALLRHGKPIKHIASKDKSDL